MGAGHRGFNLHRVQKIKMNPTSINWTALSVFVGFFLLVTIIGFFASRWKAGDLNHLHEWGLGGRQFGTIITWFLLGGDFYTAYTVIAVPALVYSVGAYGFFALPYTILVYPFVFLVMPRLWNVCRENNYVTAADFVEGRFGNKWLALAVALTGILATMPYIALQLVGMRAVIGALGFSNDEIPLAIAFIILAVYTYTSGLRAPAMIAFVKDIMIYIVVIAAVTVIPFQQGGYGHIFAEADKAFEAKGMAGGAGLILRPAQMFPFASLALGSALAAFMYPHTMTGVLSSSSANTVRKNAVLLPAYTLLLGLIALLGYMAIAAGIRLDKPTNVVPALFNKIFPDWFVGFSFSAIAIGALVPAAIMSIGAANLWTRNIWKTFINPGISAKGESTVAKLASLLVKVGALAFILLLPTQYAIDLQLIGGIWILQIFPAVVFGLYRSRLHAGPLLLGWLIGLTLGTWLSIAAGMKPLIPINLFGGTYTVYIGLIALAVNLIISFTGSTLMSENASGLRETAEF